PVIATAHKRIIDRLNRAGLPAIYQWPEYAEAGGLLGYGPSFPACYRQAAALAGKILKGAKPGDLPVEQPTKFELAINLKTAKALGLTVPPPRVALVDEFIEGGDASSAPRFGSRVSGRRLRYAPVDLR